MGFENCFPASIIIFEIAMNQLNIIQQMFKNTVSKKAGIEGKIL